MKLKKLLALSLSVVMAATLLCGCGGSKSTDTAEDATAAAGEATVSTVTDGVLTMATNATFPPYEYREGSDGSDGSDDIVGIDAEIAQAIADKLGLELKIEDMEFDSIITAVQSGKADVGVAGMTVTEDRLKNIDFTDPYTTAKQVIIVKK